MMENNFRKRSPITASSGMRFKVGCLILLPVIISIVVTIIFSSKVTALPEQPPKEKYFRPVEIKRGDTLWKIASANMSEEWSSLEEYIIEIKILNGMATDDIDAGNYIAIPYY